MGFVVVVVWGGGGSERKERKKKKEGKWLEAGESPTAKEKTKKSKERLRPEFSLGCCFTEGGKRWMKVGKRFLLVCFSFVSPSDFFDPWADLFPARYPCPNFLWSVPSLGGQVRWNGDFLPDSSKLNLLAWMALWFVIAVIVDVVSGAT